MAQLMPLPLTVSCFSKIQIGFTFLVLAHPGSTGKRAIKRVCVCVCAVVCVETFLLMQLCSGHLQVNRPSIGSASSYQHVFFKMDVPKAQNVAVVVGTEWTQLEQKEPGSWHGEVDYRYSVAVSCLSFVFVPAMLCDVIYSHFFFTNGILYPFPAPALLMLQEQGRCSGLASVCLSHRLTAAVVASGFAAERFVGRSYQSIAARASTAYHLQVHSAAKAPQHGTLQ